MKALQFLIWLRDDIGVIRHSKAYLSSFLLSNGELRRWLKNKVVQVNQELISVDSEVEFPITDLILFPKNPKQKTTIV